MSCVSVSADEKAMVTNREEDDEDQDFIWVLFWKVKGENQKAKEKAKKKGNLHKKSRITKYTRCVGWFNDWIFTPGCFIFSHFFVFGSLVFCALGQPFAVLC